MSQVAKGDVGIKLHRRELSFCPLWSRSNSPLAASERPRESRCALAITMAHWGTRVGAVAGMAERPWGS
jgi:hypothetical protein